MSKGVIIGIAGGTGSGKTTIAEELAKTAHGQACLLAQDMYYKFQDAPLAERSLTNYDEPNAFDTALLVHHLTSLQAGLAIDRPVYDFAEHQRSSSTVRVEPAPIIVIEGILVLHEKRLRELCALTVYVDAPADERFIRRLQRDITERGRTVDSVVRQYRETVRPMHDLYVEPSKQHANLIVPEGGKNHRALAVLTSYVRGLLPTTYTDA